MFKMKKTEFVIKSLATVLILAVACILIYAISVSIFGDYYRSYRYEQEIQKFSTQLQGLSYEERYVLIMKRISSDPSLYECCSDNSFEIKKLLEIGPRIKPLFYKTFEDKINNSMFNVRMYAAFCIIKLDPDTAEDYFGSFLNSKSSGDKIDSLYVLTELMWSTKYYKKILMIIKNEKDAEVQDIMMTYLIRVNRAEAKAIIEDIAKNDKNELNRKNAEIRIKRNYINK